MAHRSGPRDDDSGRGAAASRERDRPRPSLPARLEQGLTTSVNGNAQAFGFSVTITVTYGVVDLLEPSPRLGQLMVFALAAVAAFALLNVVVVSLLHAESETAGSARALLVGTATDFLAVGGAVGVAIGVAEAFDGWTVWALAPFVAGVVYVIVQAGELALGRTEADHDGHDAPGTDDAG